ncbi:MAG: hypothetical protein IKU35_07575 [Bacteroidaceae bacterium]|nr:hypothetical protein [Bacteroidaceae bacterium]
MIYNSYNQRSIANGKHTITALFICSLLLWGAGALFNVGVARFDMPWWAEEWNLTGTLLMRPIAFLLYAATAFLMSSYVILERRISWQPGMMMWITATCFAIQGNIPSAITLLLFTAITGMVLGFDNVADTRKYLYTLLAATTTVALFFPQFTLLIPMAFIYPAIGGRLSGKGFLAALLGVATPLWILFGLTYLFPQLLTLFASFKASVVGLLQVSKVVLTPSMLIMICAELIIAVPAILHFFFTASIGRTHLRRRMLYCIVLDMVLWIAGWWQPQLFNLFFIWRLPLVSLLAAYIFPILPKKTSNIYMVSALLLWLASAIAGIWIG